jgi:hypothetical protein
VKPYLVEKENTYEKVVERIIRADENQTKYGWYLEMLREGVPPSAGFGIGIERLTRYVCGTESIWGSSSLSKSRWRNLTLKTTKIMFQEIKSFFELEWLRFRFSIALFEHQPFFN